MMIVAVVLLAACKTKEKVVTIERVQHDTTYVSTQQRDSIWLHDSIYVKEWMMGDTVFVTKTQWRDRWRERIVTDTCRVVRVDSVPMPYPVEVKVEKQLSWIQRTRMHGGDALFAILGIGAIYGIWRVRKKLPI